uniref:Uncharacterized protein n=1 Tax=Arcella intermedia TaxID=1963864 RepID=A0A6B2LQY4_9EUKA
MVNQIICQLLDARGGLSGLDLVVVDSHQDGLSSLHADDSGGSLLTINRPLVGLQDEVLLTLDKQPTGSQGTSIAESLNQRGGLSRGDGESSSGSPGGTVVSEDSSLGDVSSTN